MDQQPKKSSLNVINPNDKVQQLRDAFAADPSSKPAQEPSLPALPTTLHEQVVDALRSVFDPEIPVNVYDLGLIYDIAIADDNAVMITMTLTAPGCPVAGDIVADVERKVRAVESVKSCKVDLVFEPQWTKERMSEAALLDLGLI